MLSPATMPFKSIRPERAVPRLSGFSLLSVSGPDAAAFLQAQTMNDVRQLEAARWHWNGWLNSKGRVIALFALARTASDEFIAVLPDFPADEFRGQLQRYVFRSKVLLQEADALVAAGLAPADGVPVAPAAHGDLGTGDRVEGNHVDGFVLDFSGQGGPRSLCLLPVSSADLGEADPGNDASWLAYDLAHGLPRLDPSQREAWTPQMLSLDRLVAYSLGKGCYPGQEIVARTHYLGQSKRSLARVSGIGLVCGATVTNQAGATLGTVIRATANQQDGLAVLSSKESASDAQIGGHEIQLPAFFSGLGRPRAAIAGSPPANVNELGESSTV